MRRTISGQRIAAGLAALATGAALLAWHAPAATAGSGHAPDAPAGLTVNDRELHLNVEGAPRFGWLPQDRDGNEIQTAYQIRVLQDQDVVWDSGKVTSSEQSYVAYEGTALESGSTYAWSVRTWDRTDKVSPWAAEATFDTGISDGEWEASWIHRRPGPSEALQIQDGRLRVTGGNVTLSNDGAEWGDQIVEMTVRQVQGGAGWVFRAPDERNGYMWQLGGSGGSGQLRMHRLVNGSFSVIADVPLTLTPGTDYRVRVEAIGDRIRTFVDGELVDDRQDSTFAGGRVGFREASNEIGEFDDVLVTTPDGTVLLEDDFSGDLSAWDLPVAQEADDYTLARTEVMVGESPVVRARAYTAANHTYELYLNGTRADRGASFGYPGEQYYQAADVTELVEAGQPLAIGVLYHWYGGGQGRPAGAAGLLARLVIEHADGSREVVTTDGSWRMHRASWFQAGSGIRNGEGDRIERQDARGEIAGWDQPGFDDSGWAAPDVIGPHPAGVFTHVGGQQTRMTETLVHPVSVETTPDGTVVADFGVVIPARPQVRFDEGVAGRSLTLRAGYNLTEAGRVATSTLLSQGTNMSYPYIQKDGPQEFRAFTHLGFQYLEIPGAEEEITAEDISAVVVHTDTPTGREATFESSDETLDAVWEMMKRSAIYSVQEAFVDTPTREKGQFLGDAVDISYATMAAFSERNHTQQAIREFLNSQVRYWNSGNDIGRYNAVYPNGDGKRDIPDYSQMFPNWVWRYYQESGDRQLLAEAYPSIQNTADYVLRHIPDDGPTAGLVTELAGGSGQYRFGIVDWPAPGRFGYDMSAAARTTINALGVEVLRAAGDVAEELGRPAAEVETYRLQMADLIDTMNQKLRRPDGVYVDGLLADGSHSGHAGQHSTSYAIAYGVAPEEDYPELADHLASMGMKQGPMTAHWLLQALTDADRADAVLDLLTNEDDLGWADILAQGGSFTWEAWTLDPGTNFSQSHGWGAQAAVDVLGTILGVRTSSPGAATVDVVVPRDVLEHAEGSVHTQRGEVAVSWRRVSNGGVILRVDVPVNVRARVSIPEVPGMRYTGAGAGAPVHIGVEDGREIFEVGSGRTNFVAQPIAKG